jgi:hypothetical protein
MLYPFYGLIVAVSAFIALRCPPVLVVALAGAFLLFGAIWRWAMAKNAHPAIALIANAHLISVASLIVTYAARVLFLHR